MRATFTTNSSSDFYYNRFLLLGKPSAYHSLRLQFHDVIVGLVMFRLYRSLVCSLFASYTINIHVVMCCSIYCSFILLVHTAIKHFMTQRDFPYFPFIAGVFTGKVKQNLQYNFVLFISI